jgi:cytochrome b561
MTPAKPVDSENRNASVHTSTCVAEAQESTGCSKSESIYHGTLRYDPVAVTLHWVIALAIIIMIPLGFFMEDLPISIRFDAFAVHKSLGITILALSVFRLIWRLLNPPPALPDTMSAAEKILANISHWFLYFLIIAMPLTGWLMVSASRKYPTVFFWMGEVPFIPMPQGIDAKATAGMFHDYHEWLAYGAIVLVALHVTAALRHHFFTKDSVLVRMLPLWLQPRSRA